MTTNSKPFVLAYGIFMILMSASVSADHQRHADRWIGTLARLACKSVERYENCRLTGIERDIPTRGVKRIQYHLKVGAGEFDTITLHRVATRKAGRLKNAIMLLPGTGLDVENIYLPGLNSEAVPDDFSPLIHFAREGIDAWSADYRGSELPAEIADFSFMADWGINTATSDMQLALRFARLVRLFSGHGYRRIHIGGYSAGVAVAFAVASADAARHHGRKDVRGIVAVDDTFDVDPAANSAACDDLAFYDMLIAADVFGDLGNGFIIAIAGLANDIASRNMPTEIGPPGFTNLQFFNFVVSSTFGESSFHIFGSDVDETGFRFPNFTDQEFAIDQGTLFEPALPVQFSRELAKIRCSADAVSELDGGLGNITVPVLHIGAVGGNANSIDYTLGLIASSDITSSLVQALSPGEEAFDYGHGDVFAATNARVLVWQPIVDWLKTH